MSENCYFEGSETFYADVESELCEDDVIGSAAWVSQR